MCESVRTRCITACSLRGDGASHQDRQRLPFVGLNNAVGGVRNSQHMRGEAADLCIDGDMQKGQAVVRVDQEPLRV